MVVLFGCWMDMVVLMNGGGPDLPDITIHTPKLVIRYVGVKQFCRKFSLADCFRVLRFPAGRGKLGIGRARSGDG